VRHQPLLTSRQKLHGDAASGACGTAGPSYSLFRFYGGSTAAPPSPTIHHLPVTAAGIHDRDPGGRDPYVSRGIRMTDLPARVLFGAAYYHEYPV
jgi:hypothetical protein